MRRSRIPASLWFLASCLVGGSHRILLAQGTTSAAIAGRVLDDRGRGVPDAEVVVRSEATGIAMRARSRAGGRYLVSGLEVGGPYAVTVRRLGSPRLSRNGLYLSMGQQLQVDLPLELQPVRIEGMESRAATDWRFSRSHMGTESFLSDSVLRQAPVINRDLYDLVRLVPQMSTWFALASSGAGQRFNSIRIDGVSDQVPSSNLAAGQLYGGKVLPLDAVKEYRVLFSPFDVREGSFAGAGINVVTRSGTNDFQGSVAGYGTSERLGADAPIIRRSRYEKQQLALSAGGPIVRDRLLFFVSSELQRRTIPALGPYVGESSALPVRAVDVTRFQQLLRGYGLDGGSGGEVTNRNPSSSTFARLDAPIARWNSRITVRGNFGHADSAIFGRPTILAPSNCPTTACFPLSSLQHSRTVDKQSYGLQLLSNLPRGASNELVAGYTHLVSGFHPTVNQPLVLVTVPGPSGAPSVLQSGTHEIATGQRNATWMSELRDDFSIATGAHQLKVGLSTVMFDLRAFQLRGAYGVWEFASLDSLQTGRAARYRITRDTGSVTASSGAYHALYVGDQWEATRRLTLTYGLRADLSVLSARPPYVAAVDSIFGVRTDAVPSGTLQWSPRLGFNYRAPDGSAPVQLRGGVGMFTGRPPQFWLFGGFSAYGLATRTLQCGTLPGDAGAAPTFRPDADDRPTACAGGQTFAGATKGEIDVIDRDLRLPRTLRVTLAADAPLPFGIVGTIEGLFTRANRSIFFSPLNLRAPVGSDRNGRLLYGAINASGVAAPSRVTSALGDVIAIGNQSRDHAYDVTAELRREGRVADLAAAFSVGRSLDVQSPRTVSALLIDNWRYARPVSGRQDDLALTTSDFDQPFRVRATGTLHSPWRRFATALSFFYIGGSGFPYTYVAGGAQGRGDLNADGAVGNDPLYIPRSALDTTEIRFAGSATEMSAQQAAFERFVDGASCLSAQRGRIMARNSCRAPWMNLANLALRQSVPTGWEHSLVLELQVFNVLNLIDSRWGRVALPTGATLATSSQIPLLSQVGQTTGPAAQPIYRFDTSMRRHDAENFDSYYQLQLAVRYNF